MTVKDFCKIHPEWDKIKFGGCPHCRDKELHPEWYGKGKLS